MGLIDSLRHKFELYRLEQRYTRRDKRTTFASGATYVDGEYVYRNGRPPLSPGEGAPNDDDLVVPSPSPAAVVPKSPASTGSGSGPSSPASAEGNEGWGRAGDAWSAR